MSVEDLDRQLEDILHAPPKAPAVLTQPEQGAQELEALEVLAETAVPERRPESNRRCEDCGELFSAHGKARFCQKCRSERAKARYRTRLETPEQDDESPAKGRRTKPVEVDLSNFGVRRNKASEEPRDAARPRPLKLTDELLDIARKLFDVGDALGVDEEALLDVFDNALRFVRSVQSVEATCGMGHGKA